MRIFEKEEKPTVEVCRVSYNGDDIEAQFKEGYQTKVVDVVAIREDFDESTLSFPIKEIVGKVQPPAGTTIKTETEVEDDLEDEGELP